MTYNPNARGIVPSAKQVGSLRTNQRGSTIPKGIPLKLTLSGLDLVDVSVEGDIDAFAGVLAEDCLNLATGTLVGSGVVQNISTSFAVGSVVFISKVGTLTNVKPSIGVNGFGEGDFVIKVGMIAANQDTPTNKDLLVQIQHMGQL
jgi:hypothetical protein